MLRPDIEAGRDAGGKSRRQGTSRWRSTVISFAAASGGIGARRRRAPRRLRPGNVAAKARDNVNMELRHHVAERRDVDLVACGDRLQRLCGLRRSRPSIAPARRRRDRLSRWRSADAAPAATRDSWRRSSAARAHSGRSPTGTVSRSICGSSLQRGGGIGSHRRSFAAGYGKLRGGRCGGLLSRPFGRYRDGRLAVDEPLANRVRSGRKQP